MLTSLVLVSALSMAPGQEGFTLGGARVTYGELGATRHDKKFLPGDTFFVAFDVDGIKVDDSGKVKYSMGMEVLDKDKKAIFLQKPVEREEYLPLGGTKLPARAYINIGGDQQPGDYTCRVTVVDLATKTSKTLEQPFEVLKPGFGIIGLYTASDNKGEHLAPPVGITGQSIFIHFVVVGFTRDPKTKQPNLQVAMSVKDKDNKPTVPNPTVLSISQGVEEKETAILLRFQLPMNRAGDFTVELKATDNVSKATSQVSFPVKVLQLPN